VAPALLANDLISADRNSGVDPAVHLPRGRVLSAQQCEQYVRPLSERPVASGALWWDAIATDTTKLLMEPLKIATQSGAIIANHVEAQEYLLRGSSIAGLGATDRLTGRRMNIRASVVVDAAGPWASQWARNQPKPPSFLPSAWLGGFNVVLRRSLGIEVAVALTLPTTSSSRGSTRGPTRELFFVPWSGVTIVGTQYHAVPDVRTATGPPAGAVQSFVDDIAAVAPRAGVTAADVDYVHWGLLPADATDAALPRKTPVLVAGRDTTGVHGLVIVIGEKLTSAPMLSLAVLKRVRASQSG
jgi:glycerol-3-phosphate dehydrogenase